MHTYNGSRCNLLVLWLTPNPNFEENARLASRCNMYRIIVEAKPARGMSAKRDGSTGQMRQGKKRHKLQAPSNASYSNQETPFGYPINPTYSHAPRTPTQALQQRPILNEPASHHTLSRLNGHAIRTRGIGSAVPDRAGPVESVLGESASQRLLARDLLAADEAVDCDGDGAVDI